MSRPSLDDLLVEGSLAGQAGDFEHAIACFRAALKSAPQHAGIMLYLSKAYGLSFRYPEAEQWLHRAIRLAPQNERILQLAARNYQEWDRPEGALPLLRQAAIVSASSPETWLELGRALERQNQLSLARESLDRAAGLAPRHPGVLLLQARMAQRSGDLSAAEAFLGKALEQQPGPELAADVFYSCASVYDAAGKFEQAWQSALRAKSLQASLAKSLCEPSQLWREHLADLNRTLPLLAGSAKQSVLADLAILCGYPRSGTTLLGQMLAAHPQATYVDEVLALTRVLRLGENLTDPPQPDWFLKPTPSQRESLRREYCRCLEAQLGTRVEWSRPVVIDKNPAVTRSIPAMFSLFPSLKVLFPIRDPRDVAISCFLRPFPVNRFTAHFNRLDALVEHLRANHEFWKAIRVGLPLRFLEVRYEEVVAAPGEISRRTCEFLGLPPQSLPADHTATAALRFIHSPTYAEVLKPVHDRAVGRWRPYVDWLQPSLNDLEQLAAEQGYLR
jgi:tetratricopeptide (TPR) repeat protein